jgi:thioredoxin-dependent peroxiredoxin
MKKPLAEGSKAPALRAPTQDGSIVKLSDYAGKTVVLYFYPKDSTPGCTVEACSFRDSNATILKKGAVVLGVSVDPVKAHEKFALKNSIPFPLLSDGDKKIVEAYGVWVEKSLYGRKFMGIERTTFIIGPDGVIRKIFRKVKPAIHVAEVLEALS